MQYGGSAYQMGDAAEMTVANGPITPSQAQQAKGELAKMRRSLMRWLKFRATNDQIAAGQGAAIKSPLLKRPGAVTPSAAVMSLRLARQRQATEAELATQLYDLLAEVFDPTSLPNPDVTANPNAAVQLARIAIAGKLPAEAAAPGAQAGWVWPVVIVVGAIAIVAMTAIKSSADTAQNQEEIACIEAGKCTDSGFWLKFGAVAVVGWIAWDKMGLGEAITGAFKKKRH